MDNFLYIPRALASILFDLAFATSFGTLLSLLWLQPASDLEQRGPPRSAFGPLQRTLVASAILILLALPAQLWLLTAMMTGSASAADIRPQLLDVLTGTHAGRVLMPDFGCVVLLLLAALLMRGHARIYTCLALAVALTAFRSASGHSGGNGNFSFSEFVQFFHLLSIAVWAGAVMIAGLLVLPRLKLLDQLTRFGRRLSFFATVAIVIVAFSGIYNAWIGLDGSLKPLPHTQWGILLIIKSALVLIALALGANNRVILGRNPVLLPSDATRFRNSMRVEAVVMLAILAVSGFLANSPPATGS